MRRFLYGTAAPFLQLFQFPPTFLKRLLAPHGQLSRQLALQSLKHPRTFFDQRVPTWTADAPHSTCSKASTPCTTPPVPMMGIRPSNNFQNARTLASATGLINDPPYPPNPPFGLMTGISRFASTTRPFPTELIKLR